MTDIVLDGGPGSDRILLQAAAVQSEASDLLLDSPGRRSKPGGYRRALVHDTSDGLTVNFNGDYPAGVTVWNTNLHLRVVEQKGETPRLPKKALAGSLLLIRNSWGGGGSIVGVPGSRTSLWLCVGYAGRLATNDDSWVEIPLGEPVPGTE